MKKLILLLGIFLFISAFNVMAGLGDTFIIETIFGDITFNRTIIEGTNIHRGNVTGATSDLCTITSGGGSGTDTNASTECSGNEVLLGNTSCLSTSVFGVGIIDTDTNASTECSADEVLLGNTTCLAISNITVNTDTGGTFIDSNASTECSGTTTYLDGESNCDDISEVYAAAALGGNLTEPDIAAFGFIYGDSNASTICSGTTTYLDGESNCDDLSVVYAAAALGGNLSEFNVEEFCRDEFYNYTELIHYNNFTLCSGSQILKMSGGAWACGSDISGGGGTAIWITDGTYVSINRTLSSGAGNVNATNFYAAFNYFVRGNDNPLNLFNLLVNTTGKDTINGTLDIIYTATEADDHAFEIDVDAAGFGDVKAIDIDYITGAISLGEDEAIILINIDESLATGGDIDALEVLATEGSAEIHGMKVGALVGPIHQDSGVFGDMDSANNSGTDDLTSFLSSTSDKAIFTSDDDFVIIGDAAHFEELEILLNTTASGSGIKPTFEFSTGVTTWTFFTPVDGTNGMRNTGLIAWDDNDIPTWATGVDGEYLIKITRTQNSLGTTPIEDKFQISALTFYDWNRYGDISVRNVTADVINVGGTNVLTTYRNLTTADITGLGYVLNAITLYRNITDADITALSYIKTYRNRTDTEISALASGSNTTAEMVFACRDFFYNYTEPINYNNLTGSPVYRNITDADITTLGYIKTDTDSFNTTSEMLSATRDTFLNLSGDPETVTMNVTFMDTIILANRSISNNGTCTIIFGTTSIFEVC